MPLFVAITAVLAVALASWAMRAARPYDFILAVASLASLSAAIYFAFEFRRRERIAARQEIQERELSSFGDLPAPVVELIRHLRIRYDEAEGLYQRSLRASPVLFFGGVLCALGAVGSLGGGVAVAVDNATTPGKVQPLALIETGSAAVLLGIMATGFFSWRRDLHKHALTFFCDMVHTRSTQTAIRMLASMPNWMTSQTAQAEYVRLVRRVSRREAIDADGTGGQHPKSLAPVAPEALMDGLKLISENMVKLATIVRK